MRIFKTPATLCHSVAVGVVGLALVIAISGCAQQATGVAAAAQALGAPNLNSIEYSGTGSAFSFGQAATPGERWPRFEAKTYNVAIDYQAPAMRFELVRAQGEHPPSGGGGQPFAGEQRTIQLVSGQHAWSDHIVQKAEIGCRLGHRSVPRDREVRRGEHASV